MSNQNVGNVLHNSLVPRTFSPSEGLGTRLITQLCHNSHIFTQCLLFMHTHVLEDNHELLRSDITLVNQLGIGEYGPIYDAEVKVKKNLVSRALIKVRDNTRSKEMVNGRMLTRLCTVR